LKGFSPQQLIVVLVMSVLLLALTVWRKLTVV
jgi:hypothetical protein